LWLQPNANSRVTTRPDGSRHLVYQDGPPNPHFHDSVNRVVLAYDRASHDVYAWLNGVALEPPTQDLDEVEYAPTMTHVSFQAKAGPGGGLRPLAGCSCPVLTGGVVDLTPVSLGRWEHR